MSHSAIDCISRLELFSQLPSDLKESLVNISTHRKLYPKGSFIDQPGADQLAMYVIDQGLAKVYTTSIDGKDKILYLLKSGEIAGQKNLFRQDKINSYIQAVEDTWVCSIKYHDFQQLLEQSQSLSLAMLNNFGSQLTEIEQNSARRDLLDAKERLLAYLTDIAAEKGTNQFHLPLKKKELASLLGVTAETLSRQFKSLADEGKLEYANRLVKLK